VKDGKVRLGCYNRIKGWDCPQKSALLDVYEEQIKAYLDTFHIPEDYQQRILQMHHELQNSYDIDQERKQLLSALGRLRDLYTWGDMEKSEYQNQKVQIESQLARITPFQQSAETLQRLAEYLANLPQAWDHATQEQRNKLIRLLFQEIWVKDHEVVAVKPHAEFEPFFRLNWEEFSEIMKSRGRGPSGSPIPSFDCSTKSPSRSANPSQSANNGRKTPLTLTPEGRENSWVSRDGVGCISPTCNMVPRGSRNNRALRRCLFIP